MPNGNGGRIAQAIRPLFLSPNCGMAWPCAHPSRSCRSSFSQRAGRAPPIPRAGGVTAGEAKALDDAAAMLDQRRPEAVTVPETATSAASATEPTPAPTPIQEAPQ